ncbi:hypothetical protein [Flavobacterium beibuense]|uniref:Uncharacterized protein n=1 Tax=Flavobacterium beibuense TaxID=657326 RepID=A0A444WDX3_9FLAO|nr:hypothetical protein [Flavobacterium beibuense]RYJ43924.1 hypothetical protein NU09_1432 [Flavobacterium beibuense]
MAENTNSPYDKELDFKYVSGKVKGYFTKTGDSFFNAVQFVKRNIIVLVILFIAGAGLGYYKDYKKGPYFKNQIFVIPNFKSVDYLYSQADFLNSRVGDSAFFSNLGINSTKQVRKVEVEPVVDIYDFVREDDNLKFQVLKLMADNGDINKIMEEDVTSKNYKFHVINYYSSEWSNQQTVEGIMKYLNSDPFLESMQKEWTKNMEIKIAANDTLLKQIDGILNSYSKKMSGNSVVFNEEKALDEVLKEKQKLVDEQARNRVDLVNYSKIIKDGSAVLNINEPTLLRGKMKMIYPVVFIGIFVLLAWFVSFYKRQVNKRKIVITENE